MSGRDNPEDEGTGIPEDHLDRIFLAFFTTKPKGTGLGLAIVKRIVEEHGGGIRVDRTLGKGARFCLDLQLPEEAAFQDQGSPDNEDCG